MTINTVPVTPRELLKALPVVAANDLAAMLWGSPGIGKTSITEQFATETMRGRFVDVRLPGMDPTELRGLSIPDLQNQVTVNLLPEYLPTERGPGIIFLDEITGARQDIQVSAYGLLLERRIGKYRVPDGWFIMAAGNQVEDGAVYHEMGTALSDRLVHFKVVADLDSFLDWYLRPQHQFPSAIATFLRMHPDRLEGNEEQTRQGQLIGPSPRSWERVARVYKTTQDRKQLEIIIPGIVGQSVAADFFTVLEDVETATNVQQLMAIADKSSRVKMLPKTLAGLYNLVFAMTAVSHTDAEYIRSVEILNDMTELAAEGLPVGDIKVFGIETLLGKLMKADMEMFDRVTATPAYDQFLEGRAAFENS